MENKPAGGPASNKSASRPRPNTTTMFLMLILAIALFLWVTGGRGDRSEITWGFFRQQVQANNIEKIDVQGASIRGEFKEAPPDPDADC